MRFDLVEENCTEANVTNAMFGSAPLTKRGREASASKMMD